MKIKVRLYKLRRYKNGKVCMGAKRWATGTVWKIKDDLAYIKWNRKDKRCGSQMDGGYKIKYFMPASKKDVVVWVAMMV